MASSVSKLETNHSPLAIEEEGVSPTLVGMSCFPWGTCLANNFPILSITNPAVPKRPGSIPTSTQYSLPDVPIYRPVLSINK
ncbi:hypothetical protein CEXT_729391 [Caerostris extrusa]|uniref:Uncharacterized protein n=1 Tax=Caerostris extrusa TaxID=172846 RepID=A0AAV4M2E6_CAEEX|nr:hypothetical protein CEXT_729391 [Caerostris extrusa]